VTQDIRLKACYIDKPRNSILNQLNVERLTWKKISITQGSKTKQKTTIKRIGEIETQNKFYF
jgi:hypothetical protein